MPKNSWIICFFRICNGFFPPGQSPKPPLTINFWYICKYGGNSNRKLPRCARTFFMCICRNRKVLWLGGFLQVSCPKHRWFGNKALDDGESGFGWTCKVENIWTYLVLLYGEKQGVWPLKMHSTDFWESYKQMCLHIPTLALELSRRAAFFNSEWQ